MTKYFFDIQDSSGLHRDDAGDEFDSLQEARDQAQALLPDIARRELPDGELHTILCEVRNEDGRCIYRVKLTLEGERLDEAHEIAAGV